MTYLTYNYDGVPSSPSYGDFSRFKGDYAAATLSSLYIMPELLSGSNYSGGSLTKTNFETFLGLYGKREGIHVCYGGHGTFAVAIRADVAETQDIADTLNSLEDYPVLDDKAYETEQTCRKKEAWENWAQRDFQSAVERGVSEYLEDWEPEDDFEQLFFTGCDESGRVFQEESDGSMFIEVKTVASYMTDHVLAEKVPEKDLPLLMGHNWVSSPAKEKYLLRLKGNS